MKKFKFRLDKVLRAKEIKEKIKLKEMTKVEYELIKHREKLDEIDLLLNKTLNSITTQRSGTTQSLVLRRTLAYEERLELEINKQMQFISNSEKSMKILRGELLKLNVERKTLEKLKKNQKADYLSAYKKIEQLKMDDIANQHRGIVFPYNLLNEENIA